MPEIQSYLQRRGLTLPGLGITVLLTLGAAFLNPFSQSPRMPVGDESPTSSEEDAGEFHKRHHEESPPTPAFN